MSGSPDPILAAFDENVARRPRETAILSEAASLTFDDLDRLVRLASDAIGTAYAPGSIVALNAGDDPGFLAGWIALRRAGCVALLVDRTATESGRMRTSIEAGAAGVLRCAPGWNRRNAGYTCLPAAPDPQSIDPAVAVIKLTSGSTGRPEGILVPSEALVADDAALAATMGLRREERILAAVPFGHSYGLSSIVLPTLVRGSTIVVPCDRTPLASFVAARRLGATFLPTAPAYLAALVRLSSPPPLGAELRLIIAAGAPLAPQTASRFREIYGQSVHVFYGASECGGITYDRQGDAAERGTVGEPVEGVEIEVAGEDSQAGVGQVTIRSPAVARSYYPEARSGLGGGRFVSSDLASWDDGELRLVGRRDDLINVRGKKVNPREVEGVLGQLAGVVDVVAVGVQRPDGGGEVVRSVVAVEGAALGEVELRRWCRQHLSDHKVPRSFVVVDELPRTARGKVDREAVRRLCAPTAGAGSGRGR